MKRSKIFLGVMTALLAIAGVAAAKHYSGHRLAYYVTFRQTWCVGGLSPCTQEGTQFLCTLITALFNSRVQLFTQGPVGFYNPASPTTCIGLMKYNGVE